MIVITTIQTLCRFYSWFKHVGDNVSLYIQNKNNNLIFENEFIYLIFYFVSVKKNKLTFYTSYVVYFITAIHKSMINLVALKTEY